VDFWSLPCSLSSGIFQEVEMGSTKIKKDHMGCCELEYFELIYEAHDSLEYN